MTAQCESQYPHEARIAIENGICRFTPTAPLNTVGVALQSAATKVMRMASLAESPVVITAEAALHPAAVTCSENQYQVNDYPVQFRFSGGTGSWSALLQTLSGAMDDSCFGKAQLEADLILSIVFAAA